MLTRRAVIGKAAVGAAAAFALSAARIGSASTRAFEDALGDGADERDGGNAAADEAPRGGDMPPLNSDASALPRPWELVSPFAVGATLAHGWRLADLGPVQHGSCVATLQNGRGRSRRVHLCRNDGRPQGLVYTRRVDLVVMNEGHGELPTEERLAQAVAKLAHAVAANERKVSTETLAGLLPHRERVARYAMAQGAAADGKLR